jgi:hypothetical protein
MEINQRRHGGLGGPTKKRPHDMPEHGPPCAVRRDDRTVDVRASSVRMQDMPFVLEHAQERPDGRVARRIGNTRTDFSDRSGAVLIQKIHDLALAPTERLVIAWHMAKI